MPLRGVVYAVCGGLFGAGYAISHEIHPTTYGIQVAAFVLLFAAVSGILGVLQALSIFGSTSRVLRLALPLIAVAMFLNGLATLGLSLGQPEPAATLAFLSKFPGWEFLLGLFGAYGITWLRDRQETNQLRRASREAIVNETISNLLLLDNHQKLLGRIAAGGAGGAISWVRRGVETTNLQQSTDFFVRSTLSSDEQARLLLTLNHLTILDQRMQEGRTRSTSIATNIAEANAILNGKELPYAGQNLLNLLVAVLLEQSVYISTESTEVAAKLEPALRWPRRKLDQLWKTSMIPYSKPCRELIIVWENDAPNLVPAHTEVVELRPSGAGHRVVTRRTKIGTFLEPAYEHLHYRRITHAVRTHQVDLSEDDT